MVVVTAVPEFGVLRMFWECLFYLLNLVTIGSLCWSAFLESEKARLMRARNEILSHDLDLYRDALQSVVMSELPPGTPDDISPASFMCLCPTHMEHEAYREAVRIASELIEIPRQQPVYNVIQDICDECGGRGGRWDSDSLDQWYPCRSCN